MMASLMSEQHALLWLTRFHKTACAFQPPWMHAFRQGKLRIALAGQDKES